MSQPAKKSNKKKVKCDRCHKEFVPSYDIMGESENTCWDCGQTVCNDCGMEWEGMAICSACICQDLYELYTSKGLPIPEKTTVF